MTIIIHLSLFQPSILVFPIRVNTEVVAPPRTKKVIDANVI